MNQFYIVIALVAAFARADDEPFSIGLGVLSPSYKQTVGKENVQVNFEQKDNGFSYSVGDPTSGTNSYLNFGSSAGYPAVNPAGYADVPTSPLGGPSSSGFSSPVSSEYAAPQPLYTGYAGYKPQSIGYGNTGYQYDGSSGFAGYNNQPASPNGYFSETARKEEEPGLLLPAGFSYHGTDGQSFLNAGEESPNFLVSERKSEEPAAILPAGFSYHGTEGQSFLSNGDEVSEAFLVSDEKTEAAKARGPAEKSFKNRGSEQSSGKILVNGLVGYGPGGPRGSLPVGGYAQNGGYFKDNDGQE